MYCVCLLQELHQIRPERWGLNHESEAGKKDVEERREMKSEQKRANQGAVVNGGNS